MAGTYVTKQSVTLIPFGQFFKVDSSMNRFAGLSEHLNREEIQCMHLLMC